MGKGMSIAGRIIGVIIIGILVSQSVWYLTGVNLTSIVIIFVMLYVVCEFSGRQAAIDVKRSLPKELVGRPRNPSMMQRVIIDKENDKEYILEGLPNSTFREVCIENWPFKEISQRSQWIIQDERSNDITDGSLESHNDIAFILRPIIYDQEIKLREQIKEFRDRSEEYSSIDEGVEFYD